jgi:hypothetical protein
MNRVEATVLNRLIETAFRLTKGRSEEAVNDLVTVLKADRDFLTQINETALAKLEVQRARELRSLSKQAA